MWTNIPEHFKFIGITRVGRGTAFETKPKWLDQAGVWVNEGGETMDLGLLQDAIPHDQAPPLLTRPPVTKLADQAVTKPAAVKELEPHTQSVAVEELEAPRVVAKSLQALLTEVQSQPEVEELAPTSHGKSLLQTISEANILRAENGAAMIGIEHPVREAIIRLMERLAVATGLQYEPQVREDLETLRKHRSNLGSW